MSIFSNLSYQSAISEIVASRRKLGLQITFKQLADAAGVQASFLTSVLKGRHHFNADQLYAVAVHLDLTDDERRFLLLLLDYQRSENRARKQELKAEIDSYRLRNKRTEQHIAVQPSSLTRDDKADYYLDPFMPLVHAHLNLAAYQVEPERLCPTLGIGRDHLRQLLAALVRIGYVRKEAGRYQVIARDKHLPKEDPLCRPHQTLMRLKSVEHLQRMTEERRYSFSATVIGDDETREKLQEAFLSFLKKAESVVKAAPDEKVFQMNFDLFPWQI